MRKHAYRESQGPTPTVVDLPCAKPFSIPSLLGWLFFLLVVSGICKTFEITCQDDGSCETRVFSSIGFFERRTTFSAKDADVIVVDDDETSHLALRRRDKSDTINLEKGADSLGLLRRKAVAKAFGAYRKEAPNYRAFREVHAVRFPLYVVVGLWALFILYRFNKKWTLTFLPVEREVHVDCNKYWFKKRSRVGFDEIKKFEIDYSFDSYNNRSQKLVIRLRMGEPIEVCDSTSSPENGTGKEVGVLQQGEWLVQMTNALFAAGFEAESPFARTDGRHPANRR